VSAGATQPEDVHEPAGQHLEHVVEHAVEPLPRHTPPVSRLVEDEVTGEDFDWWQR
jgi:hypothetical protein